MKKRFMNGSLGGAIYGHMGKCSELVRAWSLLTVVLLLAPPLDARVRTSRTVVDPQTFEVAHDIGDPHGTPTPHDQTTTTDTTTSSPPLPGSRFPGDRSLQLKSLSFVARPPGATAETSKAMYVHDTKDPLVFSAQTRGVLWLRGSSNRWMGECMWEMYIYIYIYICVSAWNISRYYLCTCVVLLVSKTGCSSL